MIGGAALARPSRRRRQRVERPRLTDGAGRADRQQVDGRALVAGRVARQRTGGGEMQLRPLGRRGRVLDRLLDDRMDEPRRQVWVQELRLDQRVHRFGRRPAVDARDLRGVRERGVVAEERQRLRDGADRRRTAPEPLGHEAGHGRRAHRRDRRGVEGGGRAALLEGGDELSREQRVAAGGAGALDADLVSRLVAEAAAHQLGDRRRAERRRANHRQRLMLDQPGQRLRCRRGLARPQHEDRAGRDLLDPRLQVGQEPERVLVGPVRVVDQQGERPLLGQPCAQPVQAVEAGEQAIVRGRPVGHFLEQRARQSRGTGEGPFTLARRQPLDTRRQQPDHHAERELALHHAAARVQHGHPSRHRQLRGLSEQGALADPGRALDHHDRTRAGRRGAERPADLFQLGRALQQVGSRVRVRRRAAEPIPTSEPRTAKPTVAPRSEARPGDRSVGGDESSTSQLRGAGNAIRAVRRSGVAGA